MDVSVVIPLYNEEESLNELNDWILRVVKSNHSILLKIHLRYIKV